MNSFWAPYVSMSTVEKYWYLSHLLSITNSVLCIVIWYPVQIQCAPPVEERRDNVWMGNTSLRNDWCNDNPSVYDEAAVAVFIGYVAWDTFLYVFLVKDTTSRAAKELLLHHFICVGGCTGAIICGKYTLTASSMGQITELSTPFMTARWLLEQHRMKNSVLYLVNGFVFLGTFFFARNLLMSWFTFGCMIPGWIRNNFEKDQSYFVVLSHGVLICFYVCLLFLNWFWFTKIIKGAMKALKKVI